MTTTTTIDQLDDLALSIIFDYLSNQDIWYAGLLCPQLRLAREQSAKLRQELVLLNKKDGKRYIDESALTIPERRFLVNENGDVMFPENGQNAHLQINSFPLDFARLMTTNFTHLTSLTIGTRLKGHELVPVIHLLEQLNPQNGPTLHTLKLYSNSNYDKKTKKLSKNQKPCINHLRLLSAVNSIGTLRKLTFDVNSKFANRKKLRDPFRIDLPILAQLEEFEFNSADDFRCLCHSITRYAVNNEGLRRIGIHNEVTYSNDLYSVPREKATRFTHICLSIDVDNYMLYSQNQLLLRFPNLTSLECSFKFVTHPDAELFRPITQSEHLLSLVVNIVITNFQNRLTPVDFELPSVKVLSINFTNIGRHARHDFMHDYQIDRMFPNVQVVRVTRQYSLCAYCVHKIPELLSETSLPQLEEHCARHMFACFIQPRHLRMVCSNVLGDSQVAGPRYLQWQWNEMAPFEDEEM